MGGHCSSPIPRQFGASCYNACASNGIQQLASRLVHGNSPDSVPLFLTMCMCTDYYALSNSSTILSDQMYFMYRACTSFFCDVISTKTPTQRTPGRVVFFYVSMDCNGPMPNAEDSIVQLTPPWSPANLLHCLLLLCEYRALLAYVRNDI